jgi:LAS superfamily LD-carboxypeptidase LdcB
MGDEDNMNTRRQADVQKSASEAPEMHNTQQSASEAVGMHNNVQKLASEATAIHNVQKSVSTVPAIHNNQDVQAAMVQFRQQHALQRTVRLIEATPTVTNALDLAVVLNKQRSLPAGFVPPDLVVPQVRFSFDEFDERRMLRQEAAQALERMFQAADQAGVALYAVSGYRSEERQAFLFNKYVARDGEQAADQYSARPGRSEHQLGLSMDVSCVSEHYTLEETFAHTPEGQWLAAHAECPYCRQPTS